MADPGCSHQVNINGTLTLYWAVCCMLKIRGERWQRSVFPGSLYSHWGRLIASKSVHPMVLDSGSLRFELKSFDSQSSHSTIQVLCTLRLRANNVWTNSYTPVHPFIQTSIHLSVHPSIYSSTHPSIHPSVLSYIYLSIHLSIHLSTHPSTHLSIPPSTHLFIHLSLHLSICPSICPSTHPPIHPEDQGYNLFIVSEHSGFPEG